MKVICIIAVIAVFIGLFVFLRIKIKKEIKKETERIVRERKTRNSGFIWQDKDCRRPREYSCIKCGDCGRIFITDKLN